MTTATRNAYLESLLAGHAAVPARPGGWVSALRSDALEEAHRLTVPTTRDEDWRFTDLSPLYKLAFTPASPTTVPAFDALYPRFAPEAACRVVFVDGHFAPALSSIPGLADGVTAAPLASALESQRDWIEPHLARLAGHRDDAFRAINTAYLHDGAAVHAPRNAVLPGPIHLLFVSSQAQTAVHPRCLIVAEPGSDITVVEDYVALHDGTYCVNAVTEVAVAANARVRHARLQRESAAAFHIANTAVRIERDAVYESVSISLGARISRHNLNVHLDGEGARSSLDGLALIGGRQLADTHSFVDHARPHGTSRQLHKCVAAGGAHGVFNGRVLVRQGAQLTDSAQESRNLLLSGKARVDTKPQLEIFADDVKCSHGATVGQLEADELFYLRSRGLSEQTARNLLTYGFAADIVDRVPVPSIVSSLHRAVLEQTQGKEAS